MVLNGSAYTIEIVRAGIESIGHGQTEAARALGLHRLQTFRLIVLPQALKAVLPPLGSQFILLMLNTSIVSVISADELTAAGAGHPVAHVPQLRGLHRRDGDLLRAVDAVQRRVRRRRAVRLRPDRPTADEELHWADLWFLPYAARWTIVLSAAGASSAAA